MSIGSKIDLMSNGLKETAKANGWWDCLDDFHWIKVIGQATVLPATKLATPQERFCFGKKLLEAFSSQGTF
jgi:dipeptidase